MVSVENVSEDGHVTSAFSRSFSRKMIGKRLNVGLHNSQRSGSPAIHGSTLFVCFAAVREFP